MRTAIFHVGAPKTGTSALQSFLSVNHSLTSQQTGQQFMYCVLGAEGQLIGGAELEDKTKQRPLVDYMASTRPLPDASKLAKARLLLDRVCAANEVPIFSQEAWINMADQFAAAQFFETLNIEPRVVIYIRPQVEWLNSAWWQWLVWSKQYLTPADVLTINGLAMFDWLTCIKQWQTLVGVHNVTLRLHSGDVVSDFLSLIDVHVPEQQRQVKTSNHALPPPLLKLLLQFPEFRSPHDSLLDDLLKKMFTFEGKAPWVIDQSTATSIIEGLSQNNRAIVSMLDAASAQAMQQDLRWWSAAAYADRVVSHRDEWRLTEAETHEILRQLLARLSKLTT